MCLEGLLSKFVNMSCEVIKNRVLDAIGSIRDPERPSTLEELDVINEDSVQVSEMSNGYEINIIWEPTAPHCSFANNIALSIMYKIKQDLSDINMKVSIILKEGSHLTKPESKFYLVDKQINDKERVAAAFENNLVLEMLNEVTQTLNIH